ncbi:MAG: hypothetical protein R2849_22355 [Thermomicrobiales bacterium]
MAAGMVMLGKTTTPEFGWARDSGNRVNGPARTLEYRSHARWFERRVGGSGSGWPGDDGLG